jgi:hypothetical protein
MIAGKLSLLLHLTAIFGVFLLIVVAALTLLRHHLLHWLQHYSASARRTWLWLIGLLPVVTGLLAVIFVMLPSIRLALFADCPDCHVHTGTYEHLCWYHPLTFKLVSWQSAFLAGLTVYLGHGLLRVSWLALRLARETNKLLEFSEVSDHGYWRLDSDVPCAVTLGLLRPRSLISSVIETALTPTELQVVTAHEAEHVGNRDPLKQLLFRLCAVVFPTRDFIEAMELAVEQCADLAVTRRVRDRGLIAATILKVRMISESCPGLMRGVGVTGFGASVLEQRISLLLSRQAGSKFPALKLVLLTAAIVGAGLLSGDATHHGVEFLLAYKN